MIKSQRGSATIWIVISVTLVVVIGGLILLSQGGKSTGGTAQALDKMVTGDWAKGNVNSSVTLIEYSDFQCPACGAYAPIMKQLEQDYDGKVLFIFRNFPLRTVHQNAENGARAAGAAGVQGKFFEMRDKLFDTQADWSKESDPTNTFAGFATGLGLKADQFRTDLNSQAVRDHINRDVDGGNAAGVTGTPTFFLNGTKLRNPATLEAFKKLIDDAIAKAPAPKADTTETYHAHAGLALYLDNTPLDFTQDKYQSTEGQDLDPDIHFHDKNGKILHLHKAGATLGEFFSSLKMKLTATCLTTDDAKEYCPGNDKKLSLYVNSKEVTSDFSAYAPKDNDRVLLTYGNTSASVLTQQQNSVSDEACIYSKTCPERGSPPTENCVGGLGTDCT